MGVGEGERGTLWVVGQLTVRVRGPAPGPGRIVRIPRPFATIGRGPGVDLRLDDPAVEPCHALLLLEGRGAFGVDLLSVTGTRFAGRESGSAWMGVGDVVEVAGHRVELLRFRVDGATIDPAPPDGNLLEDLPGPIGLTLVPIEPTGVSWNLGSALAFIGRDEACAIRPVGEAVAGVHCALFIAHGTAHAIALPGRPTTLGGVPIAGASTLLDGDIIGIAYDATAGSLTFYKNNVSQGVAFTEISGAMYVIISSYRSTAQTAVMTIALATIEQTYAPPAT